MPKYKDKRLWILSGLAVATLIVLSVLQPIPQAPEYHQFADQQQIWGIPNCWNVISNFPFLITGPMGLVWFFRSRPAGGVEGAMLLSLFTGITLTGLGSAWYHWEPNNDTLVWDRLPMTLVFMSFFALIISDFIDKTAGQQAFWILLALGVGSVFYWWYTESVQEGDLRLYIFVQFFPMLAIPLILLLYREPLPYKWQIAWIFGAYILAKVAESLDELIYEKLQVISGHPVKHLFAGLATYYIYRLVRQRHQL